MNFDEIIDRRGSNCTKWDSMATFTGVTAPDALAMWVADMDFAAPDFLQEAVRRLIDKANYGYFLGDRPMREAVAWWMRERHGWAADPDTMLSPHSLGNGIALCLDVYSEPGDEIIIFTPVYHEFTRKIRKAGRVVRESRLLVDDDGTYRMDLDALEAAMTGRETMMLFCSPHNPAGRVWSREELQAVADFCVRHDLVLVSDEIHHDLVMPGFRHMPFPVAVPEVADRLVVCTSASKTFNTAGSRLGTITVQDPTLRKPLADRMAALDMSPNILGCMLTEAAYSPEGAAWVDALVAYLDGNRRLFHDGISKIPGLTNMPMQATYLAWVDFSGTGMDMSEVMSRVHTDARIATSVGADFGSGGESFLRFNIATPRAHVEEAVQRLTAAFSDLQ